MSKITMTKTHPGGASGVLEMGKTYTVGTDLSATLADALVRQGKAVVAGDSWAVPTPATSLTIGGPQRLPVIGGVFIDGESGAIIDPSTGAPPPAIPRHVFVIAGQSNAEGNGSGNDKLPPETTDARVLMLDKSGALRTATEPTHDRAGWDVNCTPAALAGNTGFPRRSGHLRAAKDVVDATGGTAILVPCALGGTVMSQWRKDADPLDRKTLFGAMHYRARQVLPAGVPSAVFYAGHEGDSAQAIANLSTGAITGTYAADWQTLIAEFRSVFGAVPFIYAQLGMWNNASYARHTYAGEVQRLAETNYGDTTPLTWRKSGAPTTTNTLTKNNNNATNTVTYGTLDTDPYKVTIVSDGLQYVGVKASGIVAGTKYRHKVTFLTDATGIRLYDNNTNLQSVNNIKAGDIVYGPAFTATNNNVGVLSFNTAQTITFLFELEEPDQTGLATDCYMVVAHDLPLCDSIHLSGEGQRELGRRRALCYRQHVLGHPVNGTGPRLISSGAVVAPGGDRTKVSIKFNCPITSDGTANFNSLFRVYDSGVEKTVSSAVVDTDGTSVLITLSSACTGTAVCTYGERQGLSALDTWRPGVVRDSDGLPAPMFGPIVIS